MTTAFTARYTRIASGYMGQIVEWPEGTRAAAMRVRLTAPDGAEHDRSVWGDTSADDVLTFK